MLTHLAKKEDGSNVKQMKDKIERAIPFLWLIPLQLFFTFSLSHQDGLDGQQNNLGNLFHGAQDYGPSVGVTW